MSIEPSMDRLRDSGGSNRDGHQPLLTARKLSTAEGLLVPSPKLIMAHDPSDPRCEKIRALRTELLVRRESPNQANMVALLSPLPGEGRSQLAAELAIAFAQLNRPTLLLDADFRNPQQHILFGADNKQGLSDAITTGMPAHLQSVQRLPHLYLLTAGLPPSNPLELLLSDRFAWLIEDWHHHFDFVIIDTPACGHYSDGLAVASLVGRVLTLSRAKLTPYRETRDMLHRLNVIRAQILGGVLNHF